MNGTDTEKETEAQILSEYETLANDIEHIDSSFTKTEIELKKKEALFMD